MRKNAFTLAEIAIVLMVLGILTAILLPTAFKNMPDENVFKFHKGNEILLKTIKILVESEKYFLTGDMAYRPNGARIDGSNTGDNEYLCKAFADVVSTKNVQCTNTACSSNNQTWVYTYENTLGPANADSVCKNNTSFDHTQKIITADDITFYFAGLPYGTTSWSSGHTDAFHESWGHPAGFVGLAKVFCIDVDGIGKGEDPFGYGVTVEGKILPGTRAQEWMKKRAKK